MSSHVIKFLLMFLFPVLALAQTGETKSENFTVEFQGSTGVDSWRVNNNNIRYLADYSTPEPYKNVGIWSEAKLGVTFNDYLKLTMMGKAHQVTGNKISRLELDYKFLEKTAISVGVLPYRISWCSPLMSTNNFIREADPFCSFGGLNELADSSAAVRLIDSSRLGEWVLDSQLGYWNPKMSNSEDKLAIYVPVGQTVKHTKYGFSVNAVNLQTSTQIRVGALKVHQDQNDDRVNVSSLYQRQLRYNMLFVGFEKNLMDNLVWKTTYSSYSGQQVNKIYPYSFLPTSITTELSYTLNNNTFSFGYNNYVNKTTYSKTYSLLDVNTAALSYRRDFPKEKMFMVIQYNYNTNYNKSTSNTITNLVGQQIGIRIGKDF